MLIVGRNMLCVRACCGLAAAGFAIWQNRQRLQMSAPCHFRLTYRCCQKSKPFRSSHSTHKQSRLRSEALCHMRLRERVQQCNGLGSVQRVQAIMACVQANAAIWRLANRNFEHADHRSAAPLHAHKAEIVPGRCAGLGPARKPINFIALQNPGRQRSVSCAADLPVANVPSSCVIAAAKFAVTLDRPKSSS